MVIYLRKRRKRKNKGTGTGVGIIILMVFFISGLVMVKKHSLSQEQVHAYSRMEELEDSLEEQKEISKDLEEQKAQMKSRKFIEDMAREKFGLVYEDEYMFKSEEE